MRSLRLAKRLFNLPTLATGLFAAILLASSWPAMVNGDDAEPSGAWTVSQWTAWRDAEIARILTPTFASGGENPISREEVIARSAQAYVPVQAILTHDPQYFNEDATRFRAMEHFLRVHRRSVGDGDDRQ